MTPERPLLAFDATGRGLIVAAGTPSELRAEERRPGPRGQVEALAPAIDACLRRADLRWTDLARIAAVRGPGSFVGVRVSVAAARGLAFATGVETVGIDGFEAAAETARRAGARGGRVAVVFGAGERLIWRLFVLDAHAAQPIGAPVSGTPEELAAVDAELSLGPAVDAAWRGPSAGVLLSLAAAATAGAGPVQPLYARPPDASPPTRRPLVRL